MEDEDAIMETGARYHIALWVFGGFFSNETIRELVKRPGTAYCEVNRAEELLQETFAEREIRKDEWPGPAQCDLLDAAFSVLEKRRILGVHWCRDTISSGHAYATDLADSRGYRGYCFYHEQDIVGAFADDELYVAYDATAVNREMALCIGNEVARVFAEAGLDVHWSGKLADRIVLRGFFLGEEVQGRA